MRIGTPTAPDMFGAVKAAGFDYVELSAAGSLAPDEGPERAEEIRSALREAGIRGEASAGLQHDRLRCVGPDVNDAQLARYARTVMDRAAYVGLEVVNFGSGGARNLPVGFNETRAREQVVAYLRMLGDAAQPHGIAVAIEPQCAVYTNYLMDILEGVEIMREADHPNVKMMADLHHMLFEGEPLENLRVAGPDLVYLHVPALDDGVCHNMPAAYARLGEELSEIGFEGRTSIEAGSDFEAAKRTLDFLRRLWKA